MGAVRLGVRREPGRPLIGVALGGGGVKGLAHIGVLCVMVEAGIPLDVERFLIDNVIGLGVGYDAAIEAVLSEVTAGRSLEESRIPRGGRRVRCALR